MKKRLLSLFLAIVLILGMVPVQVFAEEAELTVNGNEVDINDIVCGQVSLKTLTVSGASIANATQDGNTINVVLNDETALDAVLSVGFTSAAPYLTLDSKNCTLVDGAQKMVVNVRAQANQNPNSVIGTATVTINFTVPKGESVAVTKPDGEGFTFDGKDTAYVDSSYKFSVAVQEGYDGTNMAVKVNDQLLEGVNGTYTVENVTGALVITVEGIVKKAVYNITAPTGEGFTFTGDPTVYAGDDYTFKIAVDEAWDGTAMAVTVNGEPLTGSNGTYTVSAVQEDLTVAVSGIVKKVVYNITAPTGEGFTFTGDPTVYAGDDYTFKIAVDEAYNADDMTVTVNGEPLTGSNGTYTVSAVQEDLTVAVSGVVKKVIYEVTPPTGKGFTFSSEDVAYAGENYTFTVKPNPGYTVQVQVNGEPITGTNDSYTAENVTQDLIITVTAVRDVLPERTVSVADGVVDIEDKQLYYRNSSYNATVTGIKVSGAEVKEAYQEAGSTKVYIILPWDTPDTAELQVAFQASLSKSELLDGTAALNLEDGEGGLEMTVTGKRTNSNISAYKGSATYTLIFFREEFTAVPTRLVEADSKEIYQGNSVTLDLTGYFDGAQNYFLVDGETKAPIEGETYTVSGETAGTYTLTFGAANQLGECSDYVAVTVNVLGNQVPVLTGEAEAAATVKQYNPWTLDLSQIFADADGDTMTYSVSVNGAEAVAAAANYSYTPETADDVIFVFRATDDKGGVSPAYTVTLTVTEAPRTIIETNCKKTSASFDGWLATITVDGPKITEYVWVGGGAGHDENSDEDHTLNIQLDPTVADDATIALSYALGGSTNQMKYASTPPASVTLVDGKATVKVTTTYKSMSGWVTPRNYTINFSNKVNNLPEATTEAVSADVVIGSAYEIDLAPYFTDADGDELTYKVSVNGEEDVAADANYSYTPVTLGEHTLVFKANDIWSDSEKNLTVNLNVTNSEATYDVAVAAPEGYTLTFQGVSLVENGAPVIAGDLVFADGVVKVPENISLITWTCDGAVCGTAAVSEGAQLNIRVLTLNAQTATDEADATAVINITDPNGAVITVGESGKALLADGSGYTYKATPSSTYGGAWAVFSLNDQTVSENAAVVMKYTLKSGKSVTIPKEAEVVMYFSNANFAGYVVEPVYKTSDEKNGTVTYYYSCTNEQSYNAGYVYRATMEGKITKGGFLNVVDEVVLTWDDQDKAPDYRSADNTPNYTTVDGTTQYRGGAIVLMTGNAKGHLTVSNAKTYDLGVFRNWNIINTDTNNVALEPDFHFTQVAGDDVVTFTDLGSVFGNNWQRIAASGSGTAFVEVSFDAIHVVTGYPEGGWGGAYAQMHDKVYNASNPNTNGLLVIQTDGNAASDVTFNIASDRSQTGRQWDAEHDTYYITEATGKLTLAPTATSGVQKVEVSNDKGATWTALEETDGAYTAAVVPGNNIVRVTNGNGQTGYQVVRVLKLDLRVENRTDASKGEEFSAGDTVRLYITGLIAPTGKMGGIYNPQSASATFTGSDDATYQVVSDTGYTGSYAFNDRTYYIDNIVIPETGVLTLNGNYLNQGGMNINFGKHRSITMKGTGSASGTEGNVKASVLPVIELKAADAAVQDPHTDAAVLAEEHTGTKTVDGNIVTLAATGEIRYQQAHGDGEWGNWLGFKLTAPEGVDMTKVTILSPKGTVYNMAEIKDGENFAYLYKNVADKQTATYQIDWNGDSAYDLTVVLDPTGATVEEPARPELTGEDTVEVSMRLGQWKDIDLSQYFTDADSDTLTYYIMEDGESEWTKLSGSAYQYYPAGDGEQIVAFTALDESMTLEDLDETNAMLFLVADVEEAPSEVTVTFSLTKGVDKFYTTDQDYTLINQPMTVSYFDLALYGLESYYYNPRCYASYTKPGTVGGGTAGTQESAGNVVTTLHAFIWATEVFQLDMDPADAGKGYSYADGSLSQYFACGGSAGSSFVNLWNGTNMNYYLNLAYPLGCPQTGSTCDQQALYNGDAINVHFIEDKNVMGSAFAGLVADENGIFEFGTDAAEAVVKRGESVTLTAFGSVSDWNGFETSYQLSKDAEVSYIAAEEMNADNADISNWIYLGNTDADGRITVDTADMAPGVYYIAVKGDVDMDASNEREAAVFMLIVEAPDRRLGDINNDSKIDVLDANLVISHRVGENALSEEDLVYADVNGDGVINIADANLIVSFRFGEIEKFPAEN